jgi:hypothetical protein
MTRKNITRVDTLGMTSEPEFQFIGDLEAATHSSD